MTNKRKTMKTIGKLKKGRQEHLRKIDRGRRENIDEGLVNYWEKEIIEFDKEIKREQQKL